MAKVVMLKHPQTGILKKGLYGFSWTTLFFGGLPAIFRGDIIIGLVVMIASILTCGIAGLIWAFVYNKKYTLNLLEKGYVFNDTQENVLRAKEKLGILDIDSAQPAASADTSKIDVH